MSDANKDEEERKKRLEKLTPPPISLEAPEPPKIRPKVQVMIDKLLPALTQEEFQYLIMRAKDIARASIGKPQQPLNIQPPQPTKRVVDPLFGDMVDGLKELEEVVTFGYPKFYIPENQQAEPSLSNDIINIIGDRVEKLMENPKVGDAVAHLLAALADKMEGKV